MIELKIRDHLIIPFGVQKWSIEKIKLVGVSTDATYFTSESPCVYIDKKCKQAIRISSIGNVLPGKLPCGSQYEDVGKAMALTEQYLAKFCEMDTDAERLFLKAYLEHCRTMHGNLSSRFDDDSPRISFFAAPLPIPQAHLYTNDPLNNTYSFAPQNMFKVDFAFWTGEQIVAVEIDGTSHVGSRNHIRKDRMLQRSNVHVIHILNDEVREYGTKAIEKLLPPEIADYGTPTSMSARLSSWNPFTVGLRR